MLNHWRRRRLKNWLSRYVPPLICLAIVSGWHFAQSPPAGMRAGTPAYASPGPVATASRSTRIEYRHGADGKVTEVRHDLPAARAQPAVRAAGADNIPCPNPYIIDGDTIDCNGTRIRLASIDAPEMPDHCRPGRRCTPGDPHASKNYLGSLMRGSVTCRPVDTDRYGRTVAFCEADGRDVSCAMVKAGHAVRRYGTLSCR